MRRGIKLKLLCALLLSVVTSLLLVSGVAALQDSDYCLEFPDHCEGGGETGSGGGDNSNEDHHDPEQPWEGDSDGRISPNRAEYYTIYCHAGTDTIYVVRTQPENETIKEIPLADAIALSVGQNQDLGDFMSMVRNSEDTITIYGSNGNLAPESGEKAFSLSDCIDSNGGPPESSDFIAPGGEPPSGDEIVETDAQRRARRQQEADRAYW